jgi:DNA-binding SARP family transcriptional activator
VIEFGLLGPIEVRVYGIPLQLGGPRQRSVLAVLLLERNRIVSTDRLIDLVWGGEAPATAGTALQGHIS